MNKVYVVMKGYQYEGYTDTDMKVFAVKADAEAYAKKLKAEDDLDIVDYITIHEHVVVIDEGPEYDSAGFTEDDRIVDGQYMLDKDDIDPAGGRGLHSHI